MNTYEENRKHDLRKEGRLQILGSETPACCLCGYCDPVGLTATYKTLLEKHHLAGRHEGPTVNLCRNCHAEVTELQQFYDDEFQDPERSPLAIAAAFVKGVATIFNFLATALSNLAHWLLDLDERVDAEVFEGLRSPLEGGVTSE